MNDEMLSGERGEGRPSFRIIPAQHSALGISSFPGGSMPAKRQLPEMNGQDSWRIFRIMAEFVEAFEVLAPVGPAVSVFGSARTRPVDPYFKAAEETSRLLAKAGLAVITGGGPGVMEGGDKGAVDAGGGPRGVH